LAGALTLLAFALTTGASLTLVVSTLFLSVGPVSMTGANAIAGLLNRFPKNAGAASALFGVFQFGLGAVAGSITGIFSAAHRLPLSIGDHILNFLGGHAPPLAMAFGIAIMAGGALAGWLWLQQLEAASGSNRQAE